MAQPLGTLMQIILNMCAFFRDPFMDLRKPLGHGLKGSLLTFYILGSSPLQITLCSSTSTTLQ